MSYIGKIPATGNFVKLDAISVVNGQASYTMQSSSVNFTPESANHMLVSLNGVIQAPISSFTVSGSTITFASGLSTGDVIDFIMVYGNVLDIGVPSDNTVSASKLTTDSVQTAKIVDDAVTKAKVNFISDATAGVEVKGDGGSNDGYIQLNCSQNSHGIKLKSPNHSSAQSYTLTFPATAPATDKFLQTDSSGVLSFADAGGGKILQVVSASDSANYSVTSTSFVNSSNGLTLNITPSATTSKIFVQVSVSNLYGASGNNVFLTIYRGSTNLGGSNGMATHGGFNENVPASMTILDSPSSTSQLTYQVYAKVTGGTHDYGSTNSVSTITAFEVGA